MKNIISEIADPSKSATSLSSMPNVLIDKEEGHRWTREGVSQISKRMKRAIAAILKKDIETYSSIIEPLEGIMNMTVEVYTNWYKEFYKPTAYGENQQYHKFISTMTNVSDMFIRIGEDITAKNPTGPNYIGAKKNIENLNVLFSSLTTQIDEMFGTLHAPKTNPDIRTV